MTNQKCDGYLDEIQERVDGDLLKAMLEVMARRVMEEELGYHVGAQRHERTEERRGHRNGYKPRSLKTRVGELALQVPQARGVEPYSPMFFAKWQRTERALLVACAEIGDSHLLNLLLPRFSGPSHGKGTEAAVEEGFEFAEE